MAEYAKIADGVEGYAFVDPNTNELVTMETDQLGSSQTDLRPATPEEIEGARRGHKAMGGGQKTLATLEAAASGATFGLTESDDPEAKARAQVLEQQNPLIAGGARVAGSILPSLAAGAVTGGIGAAAGLTGRGLGAATFAAEELTQASAYELSQAAQQDREIEVGNVAQGLLEGAAFLGIGRMASKLARRGAETAQEGVEAAADASSALARARNSSATRDAAERSIPTRAEAAHYARNQEQIHAEVNDLGYQAGNNLFGRDGSFQRAHSIQYKKADIVGKMTDADVDLVGDSVDSFADQLDALANKLTDKKATSAPSAAASSAIRAQAEQLRQINAAGDIEDAAIALDGAKRHLDNLREKFGSSATKGNDPLRSNVKMLDDVLDGDAKNGLRQALEDEKVWGKVWAKKQREENALWSGKDGIINSRAIWANELMERAPGAAGKQRIETGTIPVSQMKGDLTDRLLSLNPSKRRQVITAMENDLAKTEEMSKLKAEIGGDQARQAVSDVQRDLTQFREVLTEVKRLQRVTDVHGAYLKKAKSSSASEDLLDAGAAMGGAMAFGPAGALAGVATKGLKKLANELFTPAAKESKALTIEELRQSLQARQGMREAGSFTDAGRKDLVEQLKKGGRKVVTSGKESLIEAAGGTALAGGALGLAAMAAESEAIKEIDGQSKRAHERSMLALASPDVKLPKQPPVSDRFQGDYPSLTEAYQANMGQLKALADDPTKFIAQVTAAFQPLAQAGHPELASKLITRMTVGMQYLLANQPPALASSMFQPEGSPVDEVAVLQFAPIWEAVWHPLDTVRDLGTRSASPTAIKALREVHPDVYQRAMTESFRTLAQAGPNVDFETKRYLDNVFGFGAAVGRSFSPKMSSLLAQEREGSPQRPSQKLDGESVLGVNPTEIFSKGPSALQ